LRPTNHERSHTEAVIKLNMQEGWDLDTIGGELDRGVMLPCGAHPMFARGTPNGVCLHLESPDLGRIVTKWDGSTLSPPVSLEGPSIPDKWSQVVRSIRVGDVDLDDVKLMASIIADVGAPDPSADDDDFECLRVGDFVAYMIPDIPPSHQDHFTVTRVTNVSPLELANGHHKTLFSSGKGEVARYNPTTRRVVFPVKNLEDVLK